MDTLNKVIKISIWVPTNGSKEKIKKFEEFLSKTRDLIRSVTKSSDDYDENVWKSNLIQMTSYLWVKR